MGKSSISYSVVGFLMSFTKTRPGVLLIVVLPLTVIAIDELRIIFQEISKIRKKKLRKIIHRTPLLLHYCF